MTAEQYWDNDSSLVVYYRKADKLKQERLNQEKWLQGAYFYDAICRVSPILHAFAKRGTKPMAYISKPFDIASKPPELVKREKAEQSFHKGQRFMEKLMSDSQEKFKHGE